MTFDDDNRYDEALSRLAEQKPALEPSVTREAAIRQQCTASLAPALSLSRWQRVLSCAVLSLIVMGSLTVLWRGDGVHHVTRSAVYGTAGWALVLLSVLLVGFGPQGSRTSTWRIVAALGVPVVFFGYLAACHKGWMPLAEFILHPALCMDAFRCGVMALGLGALSAAGVLYVWRKTDPFSPAWSGALAGLVGGLSGALSIGLVCPEGEAWHLWIGHGVGVLWLVLVGARVGRSVLSP